jgi:hypothetical protein
MPLAPAFSIKAGSFQSTSDNPAGGPFRILVDRDMDVPADAVELHLMGSSGIAEGDDMTVELGHDGTTEKVFTGSVVELLPEFGYGRAQTRVRALGTMSKLLDLRNASTYEGQAAGDIVKDLIGAAGLSAGTISDGPTLPRFTVHQLASAFVHVKRLADLLGYELYTDRDGKLMFQALGDAAKLDSSGGGLLGSVASAAASLLGGGSGAEGYAFGKHLVSVSGSSMPRPLGSVKVGGESPVSTQGDDKAHWLTKEDSSLDGSAGDGEPHRVFLDPAARTKDLADRFAKGRLAAANRRAREVRVTVLGRPGLELGDSVSVSDVPEKAATGKGYIRAIRHRFGDGIGFLTTVTMVREDA